MTSVASSEVNDGVRSLLGTEHRRLERVFDQLLAAVRCSDRDETNRLWTSFERELLGHFDLEERCILPELARVAPDEAAALKEEHAQLRATIDELGVGLDLQLTRADVVGALIARLRSHAEREDALMYRWADTNLAPEARAAVREQYTSSARDDERAGQPQAVSDAPRRLVVYVEDNPSNVALMKDLMSDLAGVELVTVPTAEMGIELVTASLPDVVIMDINLPGMSGVDAMKRLRERQETREIPVIALSAAARNREAERLGALGFYRYLEKPLKVDRLVEVLEQLLHVHPTSASVPAKPAGTRT